MANWANELFDDALARPVSGQTAHRNRGLRVKGCRQIGAYATRKAQLIEVHPDHRKWWVAVHEVAHVLTPDDVNGHGLPFLLGYRDLIRRHTTAPIADSFVRYCEHFALWNAVPAYAP